MVAIIGGELFSAAGSGETRIRKLREGTFSFSSKTTEVNGEVKSHPIFLINDESCPSTHERISRYLFDVVEAMFERLDRTPASLGRTGLFLGCSSIDNSLAYPLQKAIKGHDILQVAKEKVGNGYYADALQRRFRIEGIALTYNTACTSSSNALMDAAMMIECGMIDHAIVVGFEINVQTTLDGFATMQLLSNDLIRPFDAERNGIVLGEAVSAVLLGRDEAAPWQYLGGKSNCETHSVTGANPNGEGLAEVMRGALAEAGIEAREIDAIKAHGTASELNDNAELRAMKMLYGTPPPYFSLKPYIGHTLGGCGTAELLLMMEAVDAGFLPASLNFRKLDAEFDTPPLQQPMMQNEGLFLMNYFGFGGNNTSFVIQKRCL